MNAEFNLTSAYMAIKFVNYNVSITYTRCITEIRIALIKCRIVTKKKFVVF